MADQESTTDLLQPGLVEDAMAKFTYGLGGCMQDPPTENTQAHFPLSPITDAGPYYSPLPWYGSQEEGTGDFSTLSWYEPTEHNGWIHEPFSWFDSAKGNCVPSVCNESQQQEGEQHGTNAFTLTIDPMLTTIAPNYNGAPYITSTDTNATQRKRRDSGYGSGTITFPEQSSIGGLEESDGPDSCQAQLARCVPAEFLHQFRLSRAPKLSITQGSIGDGDIPQDHLLRFKLSRPKPATDASARQTGSTLTSRTNQQRPRKPPTKTPKPKPTCHVVDNRPWPEVALDDLNRLMRAKAIAHEQEARQTWLLSCRSLLHSFTTVTKIASEILPPSLTLTRDARDILIDCCVEFITMLSSEANDTMERESKKTIAAEHIASALKELGFPEYVDEVLHVAGEQKEELKKREKRSRKVEESGLSQEELAEAQAQLFRQATEKYHQGPGE